MVYDPDDTIAAIGTAKGGALRGMVRLSGPAALLCLQSNVRPDDPNTDLSEIKVPTAIAGAAAIDDHGRLLPCDVLYWPTQRSYTRQPTAEFHTIGSPPIVEALLQRLLASGARLAEPGEFTLRAFLAGRLDLTQAEAVLGVIDAQSDHELHAALGQLAGGLSKLLSSLRDQLLFLLAELEAGLDFVDEDIEFITPHRLTADLQTILASLQDIRQQLTSRSDARDVPRVVLCGPPNVGKSSLFNALTRQFADPSGARSALVADQAGTTRDFVSARLSVEGLPFDLIDTAGVDSDTSERSIGQLAQSQTQDQRDSADILISCHDHQTEQCTSLPNELLVLTKCDLQEHTPSADAELLACSSVTGDGISPLADLIAKRLRDASQEAGSSLSLTATRCASSLDQAANSTALALQLVESGRGDELVAAELREALNSIGQVVGVVYTDDILDRIFGQFCIGK